MGDGKRVTNVRLAEGFFIYEAVAACKCGRRLLAIEFSNCLLSRDRDLALSQLYI